MPYYETFSQLSNLSGSRKLYIKDTCNCKSKTEKYLSSNRTRPKLITDLIKYSTCQRSTKEIVHGDNVPNSIAVKTQLSSSFQPTPVDIIYNYSIPNSSLPELNKIFPTRSTDIEKLSDEVDNDKESVESFLEHHYETHSNIDVLEKPESAEMLFEKRNKPSDILETQVKPRNSCQNMITDNFSPENSLFQKFKKSSSKKYNLYEDNYDKTSEKPVIPDIDRLINILNNIDVENDWSKINMDLGLVDTSQTAPFEFCNNCPSTIYEESSSYTISNITDDSRMERT